MIWILAEEKKLKWKKHLPMHRDTEIGGETKQAEGCSHKHTHTHTLKSVGSARSIEVAYASQPLCESGLLSERPETRDCTLASSVQA